MAELPRAGWYLDPHDASQQRYWDGLAWTDRRAPATPSPISTAGLSWINDRQDPRTRVLFGAVALIIGLIGAPFMFRDGGLRAAFMALWLTVSIGTLTHSVLEVRRRRIEQRRP